MQAIGRAITTPTNPDGVLTAISPLWGTDLRGVVRAVRPQTSSAASIEIEPSWRWAGHAPGQFVTVGVEIDGVLHQRCYSLTNHPAARRLEITVQAHDHGTVSRHLVHSLKAGDIVRLSGPAGEFVLPETTEPLLMITGGSGITPVMSMLRTLATSTGRPPDVMVNHHALTADRLLFAAELAELSIHDWLDLDIRYTRSGDPRLDAVALDAECPDWRERRAFVCGPESLRQFAIETWSDAGVLDHLTVESFVGPAAVTRLIDEERDEVNVVLARGGRSVATPVGPTLLESLEAAGERPAHGCRMGICHTCTTRLDSGCVTDIRDGRRHDAGSHVQLCVSTPASDLSLDL